MTDEPLPTTCAKCAAQSADPYREGWHLFEDGLGEEHAVCAECTSDSRPLPTAADRET